MMPWKIVAQYPGSASAAIAACGVAREARPGDRKQRGRLGRSCPAEVLFGRICRTNGIRQLLARPHTAGGGTVAAMPVWRYRQLTIADGAGSQHHRCPRAPCGVVAVPERQAADPGWYRCQG